MHWFKTLLIVGWVLVDEVAEASRVVAGAGGRAWFGF
jgi:hypothetical protein